MSVYVVGVGLHPATLQERGHRLEEMAWHTATAALGDAGVSRKQLDSLTLGACDELDGRPISSMLMSAPAGGYGTDEIKVTDSGATALALAFARFLAGESRLGLVVSWCKTSKTDVESVMGLRGDPFFTRPLGLGAVAADGLLAQSLAAEFSITEDEVNTRVVRALRRAARNPRGCGHAVPEAREVAASPWLATPVRQAQCAPFSDGAVALVLAGEAFLAAHPGCRPLARIAGAGWASDSYRLDAQRLRTMGSARTAWSSAMRQAGLSNAARLDAVELECPTGWHEAAYVRALGIDDEAIVSPSGGSFAQNPLFCAGLVHAAEAVLQVSGRAGPVQRQGAKWAAAHGCHGHAQQGNVVMIFEGTGAAP